MTTIPTAYDLDFSQAVVDESWVKYAQDQYDGATDTSMSKVKGAVAYVATGLLNKYDPSWYSKVSQYRKEIRLETLEGLKAGAADLKKDMQEARRSTIKMLGTQIKSLEACLPEVAAKLSKTFASLFVKHERLEWPEVRAKMVEDGIINPDAYAPL